MIVPATIDASTLSHRALAYWPIFVRSAVNRINGTSSSGSWRPSTIRLAISNLPAPDHRGGRRYPNCDPPARYVPRPITRVHVADATKYLSPLYASNLCQKSLAGGGPSTARHPDKAGGHGGALASAVIRKDLAEMCHSNPRPYFIGSTLTQHAKGSHSIQGLFAVSIPRPVISRPAARDEPGGC